jgi:hypothetical protein
MSSALTTLRPRSGVQSLTPAEAYERRVRRRVGMVWALLVLNAITFAPGFPLVVPIPHRIGQIITQGALPLALFVALTVNRRVMVRPNVFLCLVSLLAIEALVTVFEGGHLSTAYRVFRLAEFVIALWLLSPWWGRRDLLLVRCHLVCYSVLLGSVLLGLLLRPHAAKNGGRLEDVLWPIPATEVAHYAAVMIGLIVVLWLSGLVRGRVTLCVVVAAGAILFLSHTRTAVVAMLAGVLVAGVSLLTTKGRARKFFAVASVVVTITVITAGSVLVAWYARGQNTQQLTSLTGRTDFWTMVLHLQRNKFQEIFGLNLSNGGINGLPIDNNWLDSYMKQGLFGVIVCAAMMLFLLVTAFFRPPSNERALALFLLTYALVSSYTQVGFTDATTYLLEVTLAASLVAAAPARRQPE